MLRVIISPMNNRYISLFLLVFIMSLMFFSQGCTHHQGPAEITFEDTIIDLGKYPLSKIQKFSYTFRNTGGELLFIDNVIPDCSCISLEYNAHPVAPGEKRSINVTYDSSKKYPGEYDHCIYVMTDAHNGNVNLTFRAVLTYN